MNAKSIFQLCVLVKILFLGEAAKKFFIFSGPATKRRGGGVKAGPLRKGTFFWSSKKFREKNVATKLEGVVIRIRILGLKHVWWIFNVYFHLKNVYIFFCYKVYKNYMNMYIYFAAGSKYPNFIPGSVLADFKLKQDQRSNRIRILPDPEHSLQHFFFIFSFQWIFLRVSEYLLVTQK